MLDMYTTDHSCTAIVMSGADLFSGAHSAGLIDTLLSKAQSCHTIMVSLVDCVTPSDQLQVIDDIDAVCGRAKAAGQDERIVLDHMLRFFDRLQTTRGLFLIAVTSQLAAIDPAILRYI